MMLLDFAGNTHIGTTGRSYHVDPYMTSTSSVVAQSYGTIYGYEVDKDFGAGFHYGAGVFIRGPGNDGDFWKTYRVKITACTFNDHLWPIPVTGVGPATISTADVGNELSDFHHIGAPGSSHGGTSLHFDEWIKVKPFKSSIVSRPICFGVIIYNSSGGALNRKPYQYNVSVKREKGL